MLHFSTNKPNVVYIGMHDWGEAMRLQEVTPSLYVLRRSKMPPM
jgi:hypothetical protein